MDYAIKELMTRRRKGLCNKEIDDSKEDGLCQKGMDSWEKGIM